MERFEDVARTWDASAVPEDASPAATAVLIREASGQLEVLMLRRNTKLAFAGGAWVFPGGRVDEADGAGEHALGSLEAAAAAARRETAEEAGLDLSETPLEILSHWMPPAGTPRRFSTWFFVGAAPLGTVDIDGEEIHDHMWTTAREALAQRDAGEVQLAPPTFVTLTSLARFRAVDEALSTLATEPVEHFVTRILDDEGVLTALWHGDAAYDADNPAENSEARHRLRMARDRWQYLRS